jgi:hypothetical protein
MTTVVIGDPPITVIGPNVQGPTIVIGPNIPGPPGADGPPGPSGGGTFIRQAEQALSGHRVVKAVANNEVNYASNDQFSDAALIEGITTGAAGSGDDIEVQSSGEMVEDSWSWSLGPIFCGLNGQLTQSPPAGAWIRQVGVAVDTNRIVISLQPPIITP